MPDPAGLYLHIPFCTKKCAYCDFYSAFADEGLIDRYLSALTRELERWGGQIGRPVDTVYIGGGTPSVLGRRIGPLLDTVRRCFAVLPDAEITAELNPSGDPEIFLDAARKAGVNRLSVGVQSGSDRQLRLLGRTHTADDAVRTVETARRLGFTNLSLDLMLGLPGGGAAENAAFLLAMKPRHISAYLLKIEPNTRFWRERPALPDDDAQAGEYADVCALFQKAGYRHYEISNFSLPGWESRHNLKYWTSGDYLGIGPAAHSCLSGRRFYYPRDLQGFLKAPATVDDGPGGDPEEQLMLRLRLEEGVDFAAFGGLSPDLSGYLGSLAAVGLGRLYGSRFALTDRGMLVSNRIITEILERSQ